jgi:hypothetical protein
MMLVPLCGSRFALSEQSIISGASAALFASATVLGHRSNRDAVQFRSAKNFAGPECSSRSPVAELFDALHIIQALANGVANEKEARPPDVSRSAVVTIPDR